MTCALSIQESGRQPIHEGIACWTWTCSNGAQCGHGHHVAPHSEHDGAAWSHQFAHLIEDGLAEPEDAAADLAALLGAPGSAKRLAGRSMASIIGDAPVISMEHFAPIECPHCRLLMTAGLKDLVDQAQRGGAW